MIAELAERCERQRFVDLPGRSLSGPGWYAVRTGAASNDLNGVVSDGPVLDADRDRLLAWLSGVPACWLSTRQDPALTGALLAAGAVPERTGTWCGREIASMPAPRGVAVTAEDPVAWTDVFEACGWYADDVALRRELQTERFASDDWAHWWVERNGAPVAALGAWCGEAVEIVDLAVLPDHRRQGLAGDLVAAAAAWGASRGVDHVVAAPSPEGARLFESVGFGFEPVTLDVCFYLRPA